MMDGWVKSVDEERGSWSVNVQVLEIPKQYLLEKNKANLMLGIIVEKYRMSLQM